MIVKIFIFCLVKCINILSFIFKKFNLKYIFINQNEKKKQKNVGRSKRM